MLILPRRFAERQPAGVCGVNWSNPVSRGLTGLVNGRGGIGRPRDLVVGVEVQQVTCKPVAGIDSMSYGQRVSGYNGGLATNRVTNIGKLAHWLPTNISKFSVVICFDLIALPTSSTVLFGSVTGEWAFQTYAVVPTDWTATVSTSGITRIYSTPSQPISAGRRYVLGMTYDGDFLRAYYNGQPAGSLAAVGNSTITYNPVYASIQFAGGIDQFGSAHGMLWAGIWNRVLSPIEAYSLYSDQFQLLEPRPERLWFPVTAPAGFTAPVLSSATVFNIGSTYATPRVTITI